MDARKQQLERADDLESQVALLSHRLRIGEVTEQNLRLAAFLNHPAASALAKPLDPWLMAGADPKRKEDWKNFPAPRLIEFGPHPRATGVPGLGNIKERRLLGCDLGEAILSTIPAEERAPYAEVFKRTREWVNCPEMHADPSSWSLFLSAKDHLWKFLLQSKMIANYDVDVTAELMLCQDSEKLKRWKLILLALGHSMPAEAWWLAGIGCLTLRPPSVWAVGESSYQGPGCNKWQEEHLAKWLLKEGK